MINKVINIDVDYQAMGVEPSPRQTTLTTYILDNRNINDSLCKSRPAVIVCPGGGYGSTSPREAEPIATCELSKAVAYVREISAEHNIDPNKIFVCGFSAGGHLVASLGVHWNHPDVIKYSGVKNGENKPNGIILGYPVITGNLDITHKGTINTFIGGREEVKPLASLENYVSEDTPQAFIWHTFSDNAVPVANSLLFANALEKHKVKFEMHIYPDGVHGLSLGDISVAPNESIIVSAVQNWIDMSIRWIDEM